MLFLVIFYDFLGFFSIFDDSLSLHSFSKFIRVFNLFKHLDHLVSLLLILFLIFKLHLFYELKHLLSFPGSDLIFDKSSLVSIGNLFNELLFTSDSSLFDPLFSFFLSFDKLESLDLHHEIKFPLLVEIFLLESLVFFELLVSDGNNL